MKRVCPSFLLEDELEILRPRFVLTLGNSPDDAMPTLPAYRPLNKAGSSWLWRSTLSWEWGPTEVFGIYHPTYGGWHRGHNSLLNSLRAI